MKKSTLVTLVIFVLIVLGVGGYLLLHRSSKTASTSNAPAVNNDLLTTKTNSKVGEYLADPSGKALYTYSSDTAGVSNCTGACLATWPAYQDKGATTGLPAGVGTLTRSDNGQIQYTYNGRPLYYFVTDVLGQVTGDSIDGFYVAKPAAASATPTPTPTPVTSTAPAGGSSSGYYPN